MSPDLAAAPVQSTRRKGASAKDAHKALDGEVIPPTIRVVNPETRSSPRPETPRASYRMRLNTALIAAAIAIGLASTTAAAVTYWARTQVQPVASKPDPAMIALNRVQDELRSLRTAVDAAQSGDGVRALKKSVDTLRAELDGLRASNATALGQLGAKLEKADTPSGTADIVARLDKLDHDPRLADISARLDRIEHQVSSPTPTGSIVPTARAPAAQTVVPQSAPSSAAAKSIPKPATLDNWIVRDVYAGLALVEGRSGSVREVAPGEFLPGAGEVRSIERRGRAWIVVTSRGIIDNQTW